MTSRRECFHSLLPRLHAPARLKQTWWHCSERNTGDGTHICFLYDQLASGTTDVGVSQCNKTFHLTSNLNSMTGAFNPAIYCSLSMTLSCGPNGSASLQRDIQMYKTLKLSKTTQTSQCNFNNILVTQLLLKFYPRQEGLRTLPLCTHTYLSWPTTPHFWYLI